MEFLTSKIEERRQPTRMPRTLGLGDSLIVYGKLGDVIFTGYAARINPDTVDVHSKPQSFSCLGLTINLADYNLYDRQGWFTARPRTVSA